MNEERNLRQRAWYYTHIYADPKNADIVYVLNVAVLPLRPTAARPSAASATPHGDNHDLWIDPHDPQRMIEGNDGGANVTFDGGQSLVAPGQPADRAVLPRHHRRRSSPTASTARSRTTARSASPSRTDGSGIDRTDWYHVGGGESGYIAPKPGDPDIVYAGSYDGYLTRYDHRTGQERNVNVWPDNPMGWGAEGDEVPLPVDLPDRGLAARPEHASTPAATCSSAPPTRARAGRRSAPT